MKTADGWLERWDHKNCPTCGAPWIPGRGGYTLGWQGCACQGGTGHRRITCACGASVLEPDCVIQTGPSADYGGISTHRPSS